MAEDKVKKEVVKKAKKNEDTKKEVKTDKKTKPKAKQPSAKKSAPKKIEAEKAEEKTIEKKAEKPKTKKEEKPKEKPEEEETEEEYKVKKKPELSKEQKERLKLRKQLKKRTPEFLREEWFRYKRVPRNWRRPDGITSKMRINLKYRPSKVRVGFRGPKETRGLHSSGFEEVIVNNLNDLESINPKTQAARIGSSVGTKKRIDIEKKAEELEVRILNM